MACQPGERAFFQDQFFLANGSSFAYEHLPQAIDGGLIEGATPECTTASELLLYQRAQEDLLAECAAEVEKKLQASDVHCSLGLIKNCRDAAGHIYGAQENYQLPIARGFRLFMLRFCLGLYLPVFALGFVSYWILFAAMLLPAGLLLAAFDSLRARKRKEEDSAQVRLLSLLGRLEYTIALPFFSLLLLPQALLYRFLAFHPVRRALLPFLISRPLLSGAGTLLDSSEFRLSEKGVAIRWLYRYTIAPGDRPVYDSGNLLKQSMLAMMGLLRLETGHLCSLFSAEQRMQLGLSDSNRADYAEWLKIATTRLVIDMALAGALPDVPVIKRPIQALHNLTGPDTVLRTGQGEQTVLSLQRFYLEAAEEFLQKKKAVDWEEHETVRLWRETLDSLAADRSRMLGRLDWVSKEYLLATAGAGASFPVLRKIDIGYHELERGYYDELRRAGVALLRFSSAEVHRARLEPPDNERARLRSSFIKAAAFSGERLTVSWDKISSPRGVVSLDHFRREKKKTADPDAG
ncbi:MAG: proteasome accessory factor PafA2 family protein [Spirochaetales bacterium]|nr:proteasome accessory factor PafA2 family protein [Spirochaetales bacterium]